MRYFKVIFILIVLGTASLASCQSNKGVTNLHAAEFDDKLQSEKEAQLVDVRTPGEYDGGHLPNAVNIDWNGPDFKNAVAILDKSKPTFVYCLSGGRSTDAASAMVKMGFKNIIQLDGGIRAWINAGKSTTTPAAARKPGMSMDEYNAKIAAAQMVLVDFNAPWCGPCKKMAPVLDKLAKEHENHLQVVAINVDDNKDVANAMKVAALPLLILYKSGTIVWQHQGLASQEEIEAAINK